MNDNGKAGRLKYLLPFRSIVFVLVFVVGAAVTGKEMRAIAPCWSIAVSLVNIVTILLIVFAAKKAGRGYKELMHIEKCERSVKKTILITLGFTMIGMSGMYLAGFICYGSFMPEVSLEISAPIAVPLAAVNLILLPATISFAEDGLYLGCGAGVIKGKYSGVTVPAFFYALQHCFIPTMFDAKYMAYRFISFLPLTVIFCIYFRKKKDPVPIMISHALLDLGTAVTILLTSAVPGLYDNWKSMI